MKYWIQNIVELCSDMKILLHLLIGYPIAKSLLCVVNIAKSAARPGFDGFLITNETINTVINTQLLAINTASRNFQLTNVKSSFANDIKIKDGKAKLPTKVFMPLAADLVIIPNLPAMYL